MSQNTNHSSITVQYNIKDISFISVYNKNELKESGCDANHKS